jgi:hypothetical protein
MWFVCTRALTWRGTTIQLAPAYEGIQLGIGETIIMKAIAESTGRQLDKIKAEVKSKGDLGSVAQVRGRVALGFVTQWSLTIGV